MRRIIEGFKVAPHSVLLVWGKDQCTGPMYMYSCTTTYRAGTCIIRLAGSDLPFPVRRGCSLLAVDLSAQLVLRIHTRGGFLRHAAWSSPRVISVEMAALFQVLTSMLFVRLLSNRCFRHHGVRTTYCIHTSHHANGPYKSKSNVLLHAAGQP